MVNKKFKRILSLFGFFALAILFVFSTNLAFASETNGTIDGTSKYAWGENIGWINFGCDECNVGITDTSITGNAWSSQYGWINLNPTTSGVTNNAEGTLSGFAWSSNLGWINFTGVSINSSGEFLGYATVKSDNSQINFNCVNGNSCAGADFKVKTDWRPASVRVTSGGGSGSIPRPPIFSPAVVTVIDKIIDYFYPTRPPVYFAGVPKITPFAFNARWNLLPVVAIRRFVFAPLPYEVRILAAKFPELDQTLRSVGIQRMTDLSRLSGVSLNLPGLTELSNTLKNIGTQRLADVNKLNNVTLNIPGLSNTINEKIPNNVGVGLGGNRIALIQGLPLSKFSLVEKKNLPAEFVFARAGGELVDLNVAMSIGDKGEVNQRISTLPGQKMRLVVKPISRARSVTGYFVFKAPTPKVAENLISRASLTASALSSINGLVEKKEEVQETIAVENKLVLSSFVYTDPDKDGIYTADVITPTVPGEYEVVTVIEYIDPVLGTRQMRMITVIDPEGYVFEKSGGKETRIPSAVVSLYILNTTTKKYELWPAKNYSQENPQITDIRGTYSFLVPEGSYYFQVEAPGYNAYQGKAFVVSEGSGIHQNIELNGGSGWLFNLDWKTVLLIVVFLLLVYNSIRSRPRQ